MRTGANAGGNGKVSLRGCRVVFIEDHRLFADFVCGCLQEWGMEVLLLTASGREGLEATRQLSPDILLLDIALPDIDGLEVAREVLASCPTVKVVGISSRRDSCTMLNVQRLRFHGFVDKLNQSRALLRDALLRVHGGEVYYTDIVREVTTRLRQDPRAFTRVLSDYEQLVLGKIGESKTDEEIAKELGVSPSTMQSRRRDIMRKLDIHSTPKLIQYALQHGLTRTVQLAGT